MYYIIIFCRQVGAKAAERERLVEDFLSRKREAAANKARIAVDRHGRSRPDSAQSSHSSRGVVTCAVLNFYVSDLKCASFKFCCLHVKQRSLIQL